MICFRLRQRWKRWWRRLRLSTLHLEGTRPKCGTPSRKRYLLRGEKGTDCLSTVHKGEGFGAECTHKSNTALGGRRRMFFFLKRGGGNWEGLEVRFQEDGIRGWQDWKAQENANNSFHSSDCVVKEIMNFILKASFICVILRPFWILVQMLWSVQLYRVGESVQ